MRIGLPIEIFTYPDVALPEVWTVEQTGFTPALSQETIEAHVREAISTLAHDPRLKPGARVAVGVGSRGVDNIALMARTIVAELKAHGCEPFIIAAMGSHGGGIAEAQIELLESYDVTPERMGCPVTATMEVTEVGKLEGVEAGPFVGHPVFCENNALTADAIVLINRIKAHTDFSGEIESGIAKMCVIGLGKRHGAESVHRYGAFGLRELMPRAARLLVDRLPIVGGVAVIENEMGRTCEIHPLPAQEIAGEGEKALLRRAKALAPSLPFEELDVLIIDEMGKNISGAGMDTHVIGRGFMPSLREEEWGSPNIRLIAVLDLTAASHGNAVALGLADLTTQQLIEKADFEVTFINMRTSGEGGVLRGRLPMIMPTPEDCVRTALATCGRAHASEVRLARIRNTADTQFLEISSALLEEARAHPRLAVKEKGHTLNLACPVGA
jgi:hypothetical protein